jgi:hypothetical protein
MKKLIILSFLLVLSAGLMAQRAGSTTTLLPNESYKSLVMTAADTIHTTSYWTFAINKPKTQYFAFTVAVDSMPIGSYKQHHQFNIQGSIDGTNWVATGATQVAYAQSIDSTFVLYDVSTGVLWRYLRLKVANTYAGPLKGCKITGISIRVADK